jgi:hypothetical protein
VAVPALLPVTTPPVVMVATVVGLIAHAPPAGVPVSVVLLPTQVAAVPVIGLGSGFTVTVVVRIHPVPSVYVIVVVPADSPFTTPVVVLISAVPGRLLAQVPPAGVLFKVVVLPTHTTGDPMINPGSGWMVTVVVVRQPVGKV